MKKITIYSIIIFLYGYFFTFFFLPYRNSGDIIFYKKAYDAVKLYTNPFDAFNLGYYQFLDSKELIHFIIYYIFSSLNFDYIILNSILNGILCTLIYRLIFTLNKNNFISILIVLTSYYILVLFFVLEKAKIGFIFFFLFSNYFFLKRKINFFYIALTTLSHFQFIILWIASLFFLKKKYLFNALLIMGFFLIIFFDHLYNKFYFYFVGSFFISFLKVFLLGFICSSVINFNKRFLCFVFIISFFCFIFGSDRIFIMFYFIFLLLMSYNFRNGKYFLIASIPFNIFKSTNFLISVYNLG